MAPEARADLRGFLEAHRARGGLVAFDSNYRPRLWPDPETARAEMAALWRLTDIGLPSVDDEIGAVGRRGRRRRRWPGSRASASAPAR